MTEKKPLNKGTKKILRGSGILYFFTLILFMFILARKGKSVATVLWISFFVYGAIYAFWFWVCVKIAYKMKSLKFGIILFLSVLIIAYGILLKL